MKQTNIRKYIPEHYIKCTNNIGSVPVYPMKYAFYSTIISFTIIYIPSALLGSNEFGDFKQLSLEIKTDIKKNLPLEPMPYVITLSNNTNQPIKGNRAIDPGGGFVQIYIAEKDQPFENFNSSDQPLSNIPRVETIINPGFSESVNGYLFYAHPDNLDKEKRGKYLFESPGIYRIKATFEDYDGTIIESNVLTIEVQKPSGEDAAAYNYIKNMQDDEDKTVYYNNFLLMCDPFDKPEIQEKQEELINKFPDSKYARFLYYSIGIRCLLKKVQDTQHGINYLEKAANYEDFLFAEDSILKLIKTFTETDQPDNAREYKEVLAKRFPESSEGRQYIKDLGIAFQTQVPQTVQLPSKKPIGNGLLIAGVACAVIVLTGLFLFLRKKKPNKVE